MNETERRIRALETAQGTGWAEPLSCDQRPTAEQLAELADNARRGVFQVIFIARGTTAWVNLASSLPPWAA